MVEESIEVWKQLWGSFEDITCIGITKNGRCVREDDAKGKNQGLTVYVTSSLWATLTLPKHGSLTGGENQGCICSSFIPRDNSAVSSALIAPFFH
jgi:hypothetical protein